MPRRDEDESGEYEKPTRSSGNSIALWLILCVVGGILLLCGGVTVFGVFFMYSAGKAVNNVASSIKQEEQTKAKWTRDEFKKLVVGATEKEVLSEVGKPERTTTVGESTLWVYTGVTRDPISGRIDTSAILTVRNGKVESVTY